MFTPQQTISDRQPFISLVYVLWTVFLGFVVVGPLLGSVITMSFYEGDVLQDINSGEYKPGFETASLVKQATTTFVGLIIFPLLHITQVEHKSLRVLFPKQPYFANMLVAGAIIGIVSSVFLSPVSAWNMNVSVPEFMSSLGEWAREEEDRLSRHSFVLNYINSPQYLLVTLVVIALLPAIGEELVFRGMIQKELWRGSGNIHIAIWSTALIFSIVHMQFYGLLPRLLMGVLLGYLYYWSGNLLIPIISHFSNNAFIVIMVYLHNIELINFKIQGPVVVSWYIVTGCLVMSFIIIIYFRKRYMNTHG